MSTEDLNTTSFTVDEIGETTGERWVGAFKVKNRLSFRAQLLRDEVRRQILGVTPPGTDAYKRAVQLAEMFSELRIRIIEAPKWWTTADGGVDLSDDNLLVAVHDKAVKAETDRIAAATKKGDEAKTQLETVAPKE